MPVLLPANPRILVVTLRRIGDTLLTTPLIRSLRRAFAGATIDVLLFERTAGILKGNPDINDIIAMPERPAPFDSLRLALRLWRRYDLAISTQTGDRPTFFAFAAGKRRGGLVAGDGSIGDAFKRLALNDRTQATDNIHRVEQMLRIADTLGIARVPELVCPAAASIEADGNFAVVHAAPMFTYKEWTREGWRALAIHHEHRSRDLTRARLFAEESTPLKTERYKVNYAIGVNIVGNIKQQGIDIDLDLVTKGMKDAYSGGKLLLSDEEVRIGIDKYQTRPDNGWRRKRAPAPALLFW